MPYLGNVPSSFNVGTDNINNDAITTAKIADGAILNADVNAAAAIAGTKISPDFGSQNILTTGTATAASLIPTSSTVPTNGLYLPAANSVAISTNGSQKLLIDSTGRIGASVTMNASYGVFNLGNINGASGNEFHIGYGANGDNYYTAGSSGVHVFRNATSEKLRITAAGLVGIGSSSPGSPLEVQASGNGGNIANDGIRVYAANRSQYANFGYNGLNATNTLEFGIADSVKMKLDSSGRLGIGTTSPAYPLDVVQQTSDDSFALQLRGYTTGADGTRTVGVRTVSSNAGDWANLRFDASSFVFRHQGTTERARIDSSGRLLVGTSTSLGAARVEVLGSSFTDSSILARINGANSVPAGFVCAKDRGGAIVQNGDKIGALVFRGYDGANYLDGATIGGEIDGTPGTNDLPSRLVFSTTADGASSPTERMRISNSGVTTLTGQLIVNAGDTDAVSFNYNGQRVGLYITQSHASYSNIFRYQNASGRYIDYTLGTGTSPSLSITNNAGTGVQLTYGATSWSSVSDIRLKNITGRFVNALESVAGLEAIKFTWKSDSNNVPQVGLSAQSVQKVVPEAVSPINVSDSDDNTEYLSVRYTEIIPLLVAALQESKTRIEQLETKIAALETP